MRIYKIFDEYFVNKKDAIYLLEAKYKSMKELVIIEKKLKIIRLKYRNVNLKNNKITFEELSVYGHGTVFNEIHKIDEIEVQE